MEEEKIENLASESDIKKIKESNNYKGLKLLVVILIIVIFMLAGYITYFNFYLNGKNSSINNSEEKKEDRNSGNSNESSNIKTEEDSKNQLKDTEKDISISEEEVKKLTESDVLNYIKNINKVLAKFGNKIPMKTSDISNEKLLEFAFWQAEWKGKQQTAEGVSQVIEDIFGKDYSYQLGDIQCYAGDGIIYQYNQAEGIFTRVGEHPHGGGSSFTPRLYFIEGKQTSDTIIIKAKILYGDPQGDTWGGPSYYFSKATSNYDEFIYHDDSHVGDYDFVYNEVKDKLPVTTFILKKQSDGRFGLTEITV